MKDEGEWQIENPTPPRKIYLQKVQPYYGVKISFNCMLKIMVDERWNTHLLI